MVSAGQASGSGPTLACTTVLTAARGRTRSTWYEPSAGLTKTVVVRFVAPVPPPTSSTWLVVRNTVFPPMGNPPAVNVPERRATGGL